jgi:hypothetical protein
MHIDYRAFRALDSEHLELGGFPIYSGFFDNRKWTGVVATEMEAG